MNDLIKTVREVLKAATPLSGANRIVGWLLHDVKDVENVLQLCDQVEAQFEIVSELQFRNADLAGANVDLKQKIEAQAKEIERMKYARLDEFVALDHLEQENAELHGLIQTAKEALTATIEENRKETKKSEEWATAIESEAKRYLKENAELRAEIERLNGLSHIKGGDPNETT